MLRNVCVFCGSNVGSDPAYAEAAREVGVLLAASGRTLVYGGGRTGLMGAMADACLSAGGEVVGVIPQMLVEKEVAHRGLTRLEVVGSMHERKARMCELADGFLSLPGGFGTWDEMCEMMTWAQLGLHGKPCALLNVRGYYDPLLALAERAAEDGFLRPVHRGMLLSGESAAPLLETMERWQPTIAGKWIFEQKA